jgi:hypothetical protein
VAIGRADWTVEAPEPHRMIDAVWTVGHHPSLCGTGKVRASAGEETRRAVLPKEWTRDDRYPLDLVARAKWSLHWGSSPHPSFDLFLHDWWNVDGTIMPWVTEAQRVYAANPSTSRATFADAARCHRSLRAVHH